MLDQMHFYFMKRKMNKFYFLLSLKHYNPKLLLVICIWNLIIIIYRLSYCQSNAEGFFNQYLQQPISIEKFYSTTIGNGPYQLLCVCSNRIKLKPFKNRWTIFLHKSITLIITIINTKTPTKYFIFNNCATAGKIICCSEEELWHKNFTRVCLIYCRFSIFWTSFTVFKSPSNCSICLSFLVFSTWRSEIVLKNQTTIILEGTYHFLLILFVIPQFLLFASLIVHMVKNFLLYYENEKRKLTKYLQCHSAEYSEVSY